MRITDSIKVIKKIVVDPTKADAHDPIMIATTYAGQCNVVNERLKKCAALIKNNMVAQALEEAGYDPHLIDLCNEMNAAVLSDWKKLCREKGWPIPEELNMEAFNEIMKSFSMESTIEPLLKELRRANNQGNVGQCVAILRELVRKDPANPQWKSDLAEFETAYLDKISREIDEFRQEKNVNGVARLIVEIKQQWSIPTDIIPVKELEEFIEEQHKEALCYEEKEIARKIGISFQSANVGELGEAISEYENLEKNRYFQPDPSLNVIYTNALNWYKQQLKAIEIQKSYQSKIGEIVNRIERDSYHGIKALWDEIKLYRLPIPEDLEPDVEVLIRKEEIAKKRKQRKKQMGYILIIMFAMFCISIAATWNFYRQIRNRLTTEFQSAVDGENLEKCNTLINDMEKRKIAFINSSLFSESEMETYKAKSQDVSALLEQKRAAFELLIVELETLKSKGFPETTEQIEKKMGKIKETLNAITSSNLARLKLLESSWEERKAQIRAIQENELNSIFEQITNHFKNILPAVNQEEIYSNEQRLEKIGELIVEGKKLTSVSTEMKENLNSLKSKMASSIESLFIRKTQLNSIVSSNSLDSYIKELQTFANRFPDDEVIKKIAPIIEMATLYNALISVPIITPEENEEGELGKDGDSSGDSSQGTNYSQNPFWFETLETLKAFNNNIKIHQNEVQEELKKMERISRFVDLWECTVVRPNFAPEKWYFNGKPSEEFINGIKSYSGIVYVLSSDDLQPEFKANSAITIQVQDLKKMDHCDVIQKMINNISYNIGMESITQEIKNIYNQPFSPILKLHIINFLTEQLFTLIGNENALPFIDMAKDLKRFNKRPAGEQVNWLCTANSKYLFESKQAQSILSRHLERPDSMNTYIIQWKIRELSIKRIPKWVGFADLKDPEKLHFQTGQIPNEVWVVRGGNRPNIENSQNVDNSKSSGTEKNNQKSRINDNPIIFMTQEQKMGETVKYLEHSGYLPGEPLFSPYDNRTTTEVLHEIIENINSGRPLGDIQWSPSWPLNARH
ncbi:MAG: hypothetical protein HQK72_17150 [Desulfamplus sp.]|nr:hypothetical protein [Desulfamplus sp.]